MQSVDASTVRAEREVRRFETRLAHNETWQLAHTLRLDMVGERLRFVYLLYRGSPPAEPTVANSYREVHLWVTVRAG